MDKRGLSKIFVGMILVLMIVNPNFVSAEWSADTITNNHEVTFSGSYTHGTTGQLAGVQITTNQIQQIIELQYGANHYDQTYAYIYSDTGDAPDTLLATSDNSGGAKNVTFSGANLINLTADTKYWILFTNPSGAFDFHFTTGASFPIEDDTLNWTRGKWLTDNDYGEIAGIEMIRVKVIELDTNPPITTTPTISPAKPTTKDDLECYATLTDGEKVNLTANWKWYKENIEYLSGSFAVSNGTNSLISTLDLENVSAGEEWFCEVLPYDGYNYGNSSNSSTVIIENVLPSNATFENVNITEDLDVGGNVNGLQSFFSYIGGSVSRIVKGWFTEIDAVNITAQNLEVNNKNVCLEDGTNCPDTTDVKSGEVSILENSCATISFNVSFSSIPVVVGSFEVGAEDNVISVGNISTTGFNLCLNKLGVADQSHTIYWIATNVGN